MRKNFFAALLVAGVSVMSLADIDTGAGTRFDFYNHEGVRVYSSFPFSEVVLFQTRLEGEKQVVRDYHTDEEFNYINLVPWGIENELLTVINSDSTNIKLTVKAENLEQEVISVFSDSLLCGTDFRVELRLPEGAYPVVKVDMEYRGYDYVNDAFPLVSTLSYNASTGANPIDMEKRKGYVNNITVFDNEGNGHYNGFMPDPQQPGLWYFDHWIDNEPMRCEFSYAYPNDAVLQSCLDIVTRSMYQAYNVSYLSGGGMIPNLTGEPFLMGLFGDILSQDFINSFYGSTYIPLNLSSLEDASWGINQFFWNYSYGLISSCNLLLENLHRFSNANTNALRTAEAQLLTIRSHSYMRLLQLYAPRWNDSKRGEMLCLPLEITFNTEFQPAVSMNKVLDQCYVDLDRAISLFKETDFKKVRLAEPDANVAKGVKCRLALLREDWQTAYDMAAEVLEILPLTTNTELKSGFFNATPSWMWGAWNANESGVSELYYWTFQTTWACNGAYPGFWNFGNAIDRDLFLSMEAGDVRRDFFVMPETVNIPGFKNISTWYKKSTYKAGNPGFGQYLQSPDRVVDYFSNNLPEGVIAPPFTSQEGYPCPVMFGSQMKFFIPGEYVYEVPSAVCFMRSDELLLSHAEAALHLGLTHDALDDLNRLNSMRVSDWTDLDATVNLTDEVRKARKIEFWGEGLSFFDQKRWNQPLVFNQWEDSNSSSGNWHNDISSIATDAVNGWRAPVPAYYVKANPHISTEAMGYRNMPSRHLPAKEDSQMQKGTSQSLKLAQPNNQNSLGTNMVEVPFKF